MKKNVLIIFAKLPADGKVKTRLAEGIGGKLAAKFYRLTAEYIFRQAAEAMKTGVECYLFYDTKSDERLMKQWIEYDFIFQPQIGNDLGSSMNEAFRIVFENGADRAIIIGTDIPDITVEFILAGFSELENNDLIIAPSKDGGYSLLGIKQQNPDLFQDIQWSSDLVFPTTLQKADEQKLKIKLLDELTDIDTVHELNEWLSNVYQGNIHLKKAISELFGKESHE